MPDYWKLLGDGKCANPACKSPKQQLGQMFRRFRIDHGVINVRAFNELMGLSTFFGGNTALAEDVVAFGRRIDGSEDIVLQTYLLCQNCYMELPTWLIDSTRSVEELVRKRDEHEQSER